jgi:hypothetical protein
MVRALGRGANVFDRSQTKDYWDGEDPEKSSAVSEACACADCEEASI